MFRSTSFLNEKCSVQEHLLSQGEVQCSGASPFSRRSVVFRSTFFHKEKCSIQEHLLSQGEV